MPLPECDFAEPQTYRSELTAGNTPFPNNNGHRPPTVFEGCGPTRDSTGDKWTSALASPEVESGASHRWRK